MNDLIKVLQKRFVERELTLSAAESCTGGALSSKLTSVEGASKYFIGSIVGYANSVKFRQLNVSPSSLAASGAVSQLVSIQMAKGARKQLESNWSVGITGIAGPSGGTPDKPVGTVCIAVCGPGFENASTYYFNGSRQEIIEASVKKALELLIESTQ